MKAIVISRYGGPEVLEYTDIAAPVAKDNEVVVKVHAASVNPIDWQLRDGLLKTFIRVTFPVILGCDLAGEIVAVGKQAKRLAVGDQVFAMMPHDWGAQAELVAIPEELVVRTPRGMSMEEAASVPATAVTAVQALRDIAQVQAGQQVLINGASGGVGLFAVQIAKALGASVTAVCSAPSFGLVKGLGADQLIDYKTTDFTTRDDQYDVIFDCIGNQPFRACKRVLREKWVHVSTMPTAITFLRQVLNPVCSGTVIALVAKPTGERLAYITSLIESGQVRTVIDKVFPVADIVEAQTYSKTGRAKGKIILKFQA